MSKKQDKRQDLPANSDANPRRSDDRLKQQEEYDNKGKDEMQRESEVRNTQDMERMGDSQEGDERNLQDSKGRRNNQKPREQHPQ